jgi:hypothetical protein
MMGFGIAAGALVAGTVQLGFILGFSPTDEGVNALAMSATNSSLISLCRQTVLNGYLIFCRIPNSVEKPIFDSTEQNQHALQF